MAENDPDKARKWEVRNPTALLCCLIHSVDYIHLSVFCHGCHAFFWCDNSDCSHGDGLSLSPSLSVFVCVHSGEGTQEGNEENAAQDEADESSHGMTPTSYVL